MANLEFQKNLILYIVYKIAEEFNKYNDRPVDDCDFFNSNNNFTPEKCLVLPYIITIANGKKNSFIDETGVFNNSFIPVLDVDNKGVVIGGRFSDGFRKFDPEEDLNLKFVNNRLMINDFDKIKEVIRNIESIQGDDLVIENTNFSISFFRDKRFNDFAVLSERFLKKISYQNSAFETISAFANNRGFEPKKLAEYFNIVIMNSFYFSSYNERIEKHLLESA